MDIKTTGLSLHYARMTVVGIYDGKNVKAFVRGIDIDGIADEFAKYDFLITYSGACFDLPFIKQDYSEIEFNQLHTGMAYPLRRIGYIDSLEAIKRMRGVTRSKDMMRSRGCAVRLRHECERGSTDEDISNDDFDMCHILR